MPDAIDMMMTEHRLIEQVLDALDGYADSIRNGDDVSKDDLASFVTFFREYADDKHHAKEENILFTAMVDAGFPREAGPIAVMLRDHDIGRSLIAVLSEAIADWTEKSRGRAAAAATDFGDMLRSHIQKEDNVLYAMARQNLSPDVMASVTERSIEVENEMAGSGATARLEKIANELIARYS